MANYQPTVQLTDEQQEIVFFNFDDPLLVIAGPGSGKTRCATERVGHAVYDGIIRPERLLFVSFTNKAVNEMMKRLQDNVGEIVKDVIGRTIHSFCRWVVVTNYKERLSNRHNGPTWENVIDAGLGKIMMQAICEQNSLSFGPQYALRWIQDAKKERIDPASAYGWYVNELVFAGLDDWLARRIGRELEVAAKAYEYAKENPYSLKSDYVLNQMEKSWNGKKGWMKGGWLDFNDMIIRAEEVLEDSEARAWFQQRIDYVIVDESQDTGPEMKVLETVAKQSDELPPRITAVGDGNQSIYRFRGAIPDVILYEWKQRHGETADVKFITMNWRSDNSRIVDAANYMVQERNPEYNRPMSYKPGAHPGVVLTYTFFADVDSEADHVIGTVADYIDDGKYQPGDISIIYRTNAQSRAFEDRLLRRGIPYVVVNSTGFFERKVVKDCLAFLSLMKNPNDIESLFRIRNMPTERQMNKSDKTTRFMGPKYFDNLTVKAKKIEQARGMPGTYGYLYQALDEIASNMPEWKADNTWDLMDVIQFLVDMAQKDVGPAQALLRIYDEVYIPWYRRREGVFEDAGADADPVFETLDELVDIASQYGTVSAFLDYVDATQKALRELGIKEHEEDENGFVGRVTLLTGHKAKGLEWPVVFVVGVSDGLVPHIMSKPGTKLVSKTGDLPVKNKPDLEAERNWLFVAVTRGEKETHVSGPSVYRNRICPPTDWMLELIAAGLFERMAAIRPEFADVVEVMMDGEPDEVEETKQYDIIRVGDDLLILSASTREPIAAFWNNMFVANKSGQSVNMTEITDSRLYHKARGL